MIPIRPCHCIPGRVPAHQLDCTALPPSYEDADVPSVEPLTYASYYGKLYDTPTSCTSFIEFIIQIFQFLLALTLRIILCLVIIVIPLSMIAIGFVYINECPAEPCIPIFLIIGGLFSFVKYIIGIVRIVEKNDRDENENAPKPHQVQYIINGFLSAWCIAGTLWVNMIYQPIFDSYEDTFDSEHKTSELHCSKVVYTFAFCIIAANYIFLFFVMPCSCCFSILSAIFPNEN